MALVEERHEVSLAMADVTPREVPSHHEQLLHVVLGRVTALRLIRLLLLLRFDLRLGDVMFGEFHGFLPGGFFLGRFGEWGCGPRLLRELSLVVEVFEVLGKFLNHLLLGARFLPVFGADVWS